MINFLDLSTFKKNLKPVKSADIWSKPGEWHPEGLFSEIIFGPEESTERKTTFSYVDLNTTVIHPAALQILRRLDSKNIPKILSTEESYSLDKDGKLTPDPDGVTGIASLIKLLPKIKFNAGTDAREKFIKKIEQAIAQKTLFVDIVPVIPPEQRPAFEGSNGRWIIDPINEYYVSILRKSIQMKSAPKSGPLFDLLNYEVQKAVVDHDNFVRTIIQKKRGLIRSQLLGKRTDFSGRSVITPGPELKVNEIGIPLKLAVVLFEPFLLHRLFYSGKVDKQKLNDEINKFLKVELSVDSLRNVFKAIHNGDKIPPSLEKMIFEAAEVVSMNRAVIAKRDPVLHAKSVRAFKPKIVTGNTLKLSTLQVGGFNADFDGDTMAVYHPITDESQAELKTKMMRTVTGEDSNSVTYEISKEMCAGIYIIMKDVARPDSPISVTDKSLDTANDPYIPVVYRKRRTTMGRAIINSAFPPDFPFIEKPMTKKDLNLMIPKIISKYGEEQAIETYSKLKDIGFKFATLMSPTFTIDDVEIPDDLKDLKERLKNATTEEADAIIKQAEKRLKEHLKNTGIYDLVESGAGKGWGQPRQILFAKGLIADPQGKVQPPVAGSYTEGLTNTEYFEASAGSRTGIIDRVLNTADTGYFSRQLAYVLNSVEIDRTLKDCKVTKYLNARLTNDLIERMWGRYILKNGKIVEFEASEHKAGDVIKLRTPIYCQSKKICHTCYGRILERHRSPYAGIIASQAIGEAGTQTIMRTFHTGGAVKIVIKDMINDILSNDPLTSPNVVKKHIKQSENTLMALQDCKITIDVDDYPVAKDLYFNDDDSELYAKGVVCRLESEDAMFNLVLDYPVMFHSERLTRIGRKYIFLEFEKGENILETTLQTDVTKEQIQYVKRLVGGREIIKDADHLFRKFYKIYSSLRDTDSVHFEILLSQVLRDADNPSLPARLGKKWNPSMMNIKNIVFKTSFIQGLAFENINEAIRNGLITEEPEEPSILERVLTSELSELKERR
jgi:DNA-directed RNA polymerase beta' subunit